MNDRVCPGPGFKNGEANPIEKEPADAVVLPTRFLHVPRSS
jgi:hypothetical protein